MLSGKQRKLRLAARMLIEWKTPPASGDYQSVFSELVEDHVGARLFDLKARRGVIAADDFAAFLWFLSETLDYDKEGDWSYSMPEVWQPHLTESCWSILRSPQSTWEFSDDVLCGHRNADLRDMIVAAVNKKPFSSDGFYTLIALALPIEKTLQGTYVRRLALSTGKISLKLRVASSAAVRTFEGLLIGTDAARLTSFISMFVTGAASLLFGGSVVGLAIISFIAYSLSSLIKHGLNASITYEGKERLVKDEIIWFIYSRILKMEDLDVKSKLMPTIYRTRCVDAFIKMLNDDDQIFFALVRSGVERWRRAAIEVVDVSPEERVKACLKVLLNRQISMDIKRDVFGWLCRVRMTDAPVMTDKLV